MTSQFIRLHCYGEHPGARRKSHENAHDIIDEAARVPGSTPHIRKPQPPNQVHGMPLEYLRARMTDFVALARDRRGARLRRDGTVLYAVVSSYPLAWRHLRSPEDHAQYQRWLVAVVKWLETQFGDQLQSVVEHVDEGRPHVHGFVIPLLSPRNRIDHRLHPGHAAREAVLQGTGDRLAGERAYREGMRLWQNDFHAAVSSHFGHERIGPRRQRSRRDVALIRQSSDRFLEGAQTILERLGERLEAQAMPPGIRATGEIETIAGLVRDARSRLLSGRTDALETLETALADLLEADQGQGGNRDDGLDPPDLVEPACLKRDEDDDPQPDRVADLDPDDDPDPEAPEEDDVDHEWNADADEPYPEPIDWTDESDPDR